MEQEQDNQYEQLQFDLNIGQDLTLKEYADFIHPEDAYITVATKVNDEWIEKNYKTENWLQSVEISPYINSYNSMNTFFIPRRGNNNVRHLNAFFVDLDTYNVGISKTEAIEQIDFLINTNRIPTPTFIIDSGRGLYAIWKINSVPGKFKNVQKLYNHIQNYLIQMTEQIGSDPQASDMARVLRTPGSFNTKNDSVVKVLKSENIVYAMRYLQAFMNNNIGYELEAIDEEKLTKKLKKTIRKTDQLARLFNYFTLAIARENDLRKLCELRIYNVVGYRNAIIHIYAYQVLLIEKNKHVAKAKTEELNSKFNAPLLDRNIREVMETVYRAYQAHLKNRQKGYNYRNQTIIQKLEITAEEQKEMQTLISFTEKRKRDYIRRHNSRRSNDGLTDKQRVIQARKLRVLQLHKEGFSTRDIALKLNVGKSTVARDLT